jgi:hypothetical protein
MRPVRFLHEGVEVDAALAGDLGGVEEQVHQHGLAAPDRADEVEAVRRGGRRAQLARAALAEQARQHAALRRPPLRIVAAQADPQALQQLGGVGLGGVRPQRAGGDAGAIGRQRAAGQRARVGGK